MSVCAVLYNYKTFDILLRECRAVYKFRVYTENCNGC